VAVSVLFDARLVLPKPTGIGRYVASLVPELVGLAPDWTFHVLRRRDPWPGYGVEAWAAPNVRHHVTDEPHMSLAQHVRVPLRARRLGADLVHYPHFDAPVLFGRVPVVATIHDLLHLVAGAGASGLPAPKRAYMRLACRATTRRAAAILADSRATASDIARLFGPRATTVVVPLAADPRFARADEAAIARFRRAHGLHRPFVLCVGEFRPHKNHAGLIAGWAASRARATHDLVLVGQRHPGGISPESLAAAHGAAERVRVLSGLSSDELVEAYSAADVFALVSLYEGFGLPILEAMACETPVIASSTTAAGEVAGDAGLLVDPADPRGLADALDRVLGSEAERRRLVAAGRTRCRAFSWRRTAELTLEVYRSVRERTR
jgi:glycosyltransferase involved in cell wall biosynthesis